MKAQKTNAARQLDKAGSRYSLVPYSVDETDLSAVHLAEQLRQDVSRIFKTLVLAGDKSGYLVCLVPGGDEVDLKKIAKLSGNKKCDMVPLKDLLPLTGYIRGGCSPIGMKKRFPTYVHETVFDFDTVFVSAGQRGLQLEISPKDLVRQTNAVVGTFIA